MHQQWSDYILNRIELGVLLVDRECKILLWNQYMEHHTGRTAEEVLGQKLFDVFPELPVKWLEKKIQSVFVLKNFAFTSWEQRPWLFKFPHHRPITGGIDFMQQNCVFMPIRQGDSVDAVCIQIFDVTDTAIYQRQLQDAMQRLEESNNRDGLTGIFNRRYLQNRLAAEFDRARRYGGDITLVMFDLDHFKKVNDVYGHLAGDMVLKYVSTTVQSKLRSSDILGRYGGEEFLLILPETPAEGAVLLADRIRAAIAATPVIFNEFEIPVTTSLGVQILTPEHARPEDWMAQADEALYYSKHHGRNQVTLYGPHVKDSVPPPGEGH